MTSLSRLERINLALWRKTSTSPEGFAIRCPNHALAISTRQGLYRSIKLYRGRPDLDPILSEAADKFVVSIDAESFTLTFTPRKILEALELQLALLGIEESDLETHTERLAKESLNRMLDQSSKPLTPEKSSTPFYTRED